MKNIIFENKDIVFESTDEEVVFSCSRCGQMGHGNPIRSIKKKNNFIRSYHPHCSDAEIYEVQFPPKPIMSSQKIDMFQEIANASNLKPLEDKGLTEKKNRLKAILRGNEIEDMASSIIEDQFPRERAEDKPKARIELNFNGLLILDHPYKKEITSKYHIIKEIRWDSQLKNWVCKIDTADFETCRFLTTIYKEIPQFDWLISKEAFKAIEDRKKYHENSFKASKALKNIKKADDIDIDLSFLKKELRPFQKVGVAFLDKIGGVGMIGDTQGLGKSVQSIAFSTYKNYYTIIVCPAGLKYNWVQEINKFTNRSSVILTDFDPDSLDPKNKLADYVIVNYDQLLKYEKYFKKAKFDCVILDESPYIMNSKTKRSKAVFKYFKKIPSRICLSGTPIKNRPIDFYNQLKFLRPDLFSNKQKFGLRYCDAKDNGYGWDYTGNSNLQELHLKISSFYIRRLKEEVLKELPPKTITKLEFDLNANERREYDKISKAAKKSYTVRDKKETIQSIMKLRMLCSQLKLGKVVDFVEEFLKSSDDRKIIIFSTFTATQQALKEKFKDCVHILKDDTQEKRHEAKELFQNDPKRRVLVASTLAAGIGLTLTAADTVVFADLLWSPSDHEQATDRVHRITQEKHVFIYYMLFKDTIEEYIWDVIGEKILIINKAVDGRKEEEKKKESMAVQKLVIQNILNQVKKINSPTTTT